MKTLKWLVRREYWENKGSMLWAPLAIGLLMLLAVGAIMAYWGTTEHIGGKITIKGHPATAPAMLTAMPEQIKIAVSEQVAKDYALAATPLFATMGFIIFLYCLSALYDERRDRSILFWKSLPISDELSVLSKVFVALCVVPLITIVVSILVSASMLLMGCITVGANGWNAFGYVFGSTQFYLAPFRLLTLLPVYMVWALPSIGWLLMVSAWARSKVFMWAVGIPLIFIVLVKWFTYIVGDFGDGFSLANWIARNVVLRAFAGLEPGAWFVYTLDSPRSLMLPMAQGLNWNAVIQHSWSSLASPDAIIGALAGCAMILGAIRLRRWRDET